MFIAVAALKLKQAQGSLNERKQRKPRLTSIQSSY